MIDFKNLPRWLFASTNTEIVSRTGNLITFTEGLDRDTYPRETAEFRMDGPRLEQISSGYWKCWIAINILLQITMDNKDFHKKYVMTGQVISALKDPIKVLRLGDGPEDDGSFIGCLEVIHDRSNVIRVNHFGQIDKTLRLEQSTIEAHYQMFLAED